MIEEKTFRVFTRLALTSVLVFATRCLLAQQFPVQATTIITPPYSVFLSDYTSSDNDNLQLLLLLREINRTQYKVKLRLKIEGQNVKLTTKPTYLPPAIVISGGVTTFLSGFDIRAYFNPNNLDFTGISKAEFMRTGKLPEGFYTITFEVLDYGRGSVVSNLSTASAWMILNDPPFVNLPFKNQKLIASDPQNITFSWTPRHTASPNAAFNTEYEFSVVEVYPASRNPEDAVRSSNSIFTTRTTLTSLNYGIAEPLLIPGRKYAFRIRAMDISGRDLFKNNGYSETHVFQYGDACLPAKNMTGEALDMSRIKIEWQPDPIHSAFRVKYREKNSSEWIEDPVSTDYLIIPDLKPNTDYEYQLKPVCGTIHGAFSPAAIVKTPEQTETPYQCRVEPLPFELVPTELSRQLKVNDWIKMTDLEIRITEITKSQNGIYSALGTAQIPMFNLAHVRIKLTDIKVNDQMRVISGRYVTIYNPRSKFARTIDFTNTADSSSLRSTSTADNIFSGVDVSVTGDISLVLADSTSATITVTLADQSVQNIPRPVDPSTGTYQEVRLTDSNGDRWIVERNGRVRQAPSVPVAPAVLTDGRQIDFIVTFADNGNHSAGLDVKDGALGTYESVSIRGTNYFIPWKSVEFGKTDYVNARTAKNTFPTFVGFKTDSRLVSTLPSSAASDKTLSVEGISEGTEPMKAYVLLKEPGQTDTTEIDVGKISLVTYRRIENVIHIVPVNGVTPPTIQSLATELNRIYGQAVAGWTVRLEDNFTIDQSYITNIDQQESGEVASYNPKMRAFNRAYKNTHDVDRSHFYIFLMNGSNSTRKGFIPFKRGIGYIFADQPGINVATTIAHELGHGAFHLKHTFSDFPHVPMNSTPNLMDYAGGTQLKKYQWDYVHHPQAMIGWLQDDEESAMKSLLTSKYVFMHDQLSTRAYASNAGAEDQFTQEAVDYVDSKLYELDTAGVKTYIYFGYIWFHAGNIDRFDQLVENTFNHAIDSIKQNLNVKDFNLLAIVNAKYDTALANGVRTVSFREKFFPMTGLAQQCVKSVNDYINSGYKKVFVNGLDAALKERADKLQASLKNCEIVVPEEIIIHYKRKGRNQYRTWGEFTIVGTDYKGYVLEKDEGENSTNLEPCKRHPAGTYELVYSDATNGSTKFNGLVVLLKVHPSYKLHGGNRADQSLGCLLINKNSPQYDKYPEAYQSKIEDICNLPGDPRQPNPNKCSVANPYYDHDDLNNPAYLLRNYIAQMEADIKEKYKLENVTKKIIIDESDEIIDP